MSYILAPLPKLQVVDDNGTPLSGGLLYTYVAGSSTPLATYKDSIGTANANPIVFDSGGRCSLWIDQQKAYKFILTTAAGVMVWTVDNVNAAGVSSITYVTTIAALKALTGVDGEVVRVLGYYAANDGGGGDFVFSSGSSATPDNGMVIAPTAGSGNWLRQANGFVDLRWFGAKGDGTTNDMLALSYANTYAVAQSPVWTVYVNPGTYNIGGSVWGNNTVPLKLSSNAALKWDAFAWGSANVIIDPQDKSKHFTMSGAATIALTGITDLYPEWFGAKGDGSFANNTKTTDDQTAIQYCINSATAGQTIVFDSGKKYWSSILSWKAGVSLRGSAKTIRDNASMYRGALYFAGTSGNFIALTNSGTGGLLGINASDLVIDGNSFAAIALALDTYGSNIESCVIRNSTSGIVFTGSSASINNRVVDCRFDTCTTGISNSGAGSTSGIIQGCSFPVCTNDISLTVTTGWVVKNNTDANGYNTVEKFSSTLVGNTASSQAVTESAAAKVVIYNETILGGTANNITQIKAEGGWVDTSATHTTASDVWNRKHLIRFTTAATNASAGIHDSLGLQTANKTPKTDTRAWYERHMDGSHHWGDQATELISIDGSGNINQLAGTAQFLAISGTSLTLTATKGANISTASDATLTPDHEYHLVVTSAYGVLKYISTMGGVVGRKIRLTFDSDLQLSHNDVSAPPALYAKLYLFLNTGAAGSSYMGTGKPTYEFVYDGTYWRNIGVIVYFAS
jgi:hypothetical protein